MSKSNLTEAAADILKASKNNAGSESFDTKKPSVTTPGQTVQQLGTAGHKTTDPNYDAAKSIKKATPPGATPPVGSEPLKTLSGQPQQTQGRKDLAGSPEGSETSCDDKVNRKKGPVAKNTSPVNSGAKAPMVPEGEEDEDWEPEDEDQEWDDEEELEEATMEEVEKDLKELDDKTFQKKYRMSKQEVVSQLKGMQKQKDNMKEDIDAMLAGENLSEEFKEKATIIFEAAVNARVEEIAQELEEKFTQEFESTIESVKEDFAEKLDSYLDYVVENWMVENEIAIEKGLRTEIVEDFIGGLKNLFVEHYIDIPEEETNIVEELVAKVEELEGKVNEEIERNIQLKQSINEHKKQETIAAVCEGLTLSQAEKIKSIAESVDFVSEEDFGSKVETIKESYFPSYVKSASPDDYNDPVELDESYTTKVVDPLVAQYAAKITKLSKF